MTEWDGKQNSMEIDNHCRMPNASSDDGLANRADEARKRDLEEHIKESEAKNE